MYESFSWTKAFSVDSEANLVNWSEVCLNAGLHWRLMFFLTCFFSLDNYLGEIKCAIVFGYLHGNADIECVFFFSSIWPVKNIWWLSTAQSQTISLWYSERASEQVGYPLLQKRYNFWGRMLKSWHKRKEDEKKIRKEVEKRHLIKDNNTEHLEEDLVQKKSV